ncbi:MAG: SpaA isopeptide-forming pilin-related protein, partial [Clostridia bacterium]
EVGAEFEVYLKSAGSYESTRTFERDFLTTNKYGFAKTKLLPYGVYVLKQVKAQAGYAIKSPMDIFIRGTEDPADPPILTINNQAIRYRLKFIKVDAETGNTIAVANTAFKLKDGDGNYVTQTVHYPNEIMIDTFYTDESGEVTLPETVTYGMYYVEELVSPDGYLILTEDLGVFVG